MKHAITLLATFFLTSIAAADKLDLKDGDRVVLIGNTLIEREQRYGYWETMLTSRYPDKNITFRNLGWSGDNVFGEARAGFGTVADGFKHLKDHVIALKPTVLIIGYGANEAWEGEKGLPKFKQGLNTLLDTLAVTKAKVVLLSPLKQEDLGRPLPEPTEQNKRLEIYRNAIADIAKTRGLLFVDLFGIEALLLTYNGVHLTEEGYLLTALTLAGSLQLPQEATAIDMVRLRQTIIAKNEAYFHRWRPQNETYLFGFRKHEQGQNAREIPLFDPIVEKLEAEIAKLRKPVPHTYELIRVPEKGK